MLAILSTDLIASEGHYHSTCYKAYTWKVAKSNKIVENSESKGTDMEEAHCVEEDAYCNAERLAHEELYTYIRNELIPKPQIVQMTYLVSRLESSLTSLCIDNVKKSALYTGINFGVAVMLLCFDLGMLGFVFLRAKPSTFG